MVDQLIISLPIYIVFSNRATSSWWLSFARYAQKMTWKSFHSATRSVTSEIRLLKKILSHNPTISFQIIFIPRLIKFTFT